jgi:hypothetical protein
MMVCHPQTLCILHSPKRKFNKNLHANPIKDIAENVHEQPTDEQREDTGR